MVGQDIGGIIGMSVVKDAPEKFDGIVLMNSALPTGFSAEDILRNRPIETARTNLPFLVLRATVALFGTGLPIVSASLSVADSIPICKHIHTSYRAKCIGGSSGSTRS